MKKLLSLILVGVISLSCLVGCDSSKEDADSSNGVKYANGTRTETEYTSEWLSLKYTLGDEYIMSTDEELDAIMKQQAGILAEDDGENQQLIDHMTTAIVYEMMAIKSDNSNNIIIIAEKLALPSMKEKQYIEASKVQLDSLPTDGITYQDVTTRTIGGVEFTELPYEMKVGSDVVKQTMLLKNMSDRMAIITLTYVDEAGLDELIAGFSALA